MRREGGRGSHSSRFLSSREEHRRHLLFLFIFSLRKSPGAVLLVQSFLLARCSLISSSLPCKASSFCTFLLLPLPFQCSQFQAFFECPSLFPSLSAHLNSIDAPFVRGVATRRGHSWWSCEGKAKGLLPRPCCPLERRLTGGVSSDCVSPRCVSFTCLPVPVLAVSRVSGFFSANL